MRDGGPFAFIGGLISLATSAGIGAYQNRNNRADNAEYRSGNYNMSVQISKYDDHGVLMDHYHIKRIKQNIRSEYPNMSEHNLDKVAWMAAGKHMMEHASTFNYYIPRDMRSIDDISRFVKDDCIK